MGGDTFILASESNRRKKILELINLNFQAMPSKLEESKVKIANNQPHLYCMEMSHLKAKIISKQYMNNYVIGADTIVYCENTILEKPKDNSEAKKFLNQLSNNKHTVYTGVSVMHFNNKTNIQFYDKTDIEFYKLLEYDINYYINNYKPFDKSGAYGIQDWSCLFAKKITGCFYNIVGFPISKFYQIMRNNNINIFTNE